MHPVFIKMLCIAAGGALGATSRFVVAHFVQRAAGPDFPWGVLAVNALGCLIIGVLGAYFTDDVELAVPWRVFIFIGLLGGFTTFSTFSFETLELAMEGFWLRAGAYVAATNVVCLGMTWLGFRTTSAWMGA